MAVTGSSFLIVNRSDDVRTGWNNFGASSNNQTSSSTLTSLGVSEGASEWIKLGAGGASLATEALVINQRLKATTSTIESIANVSDNSAQRGVLGENAGASQAKEVIEGGSGQAIAGHGYYQYGSGDVVIPSGTSVITSPYGVKISDGTGRFLENIDTTAFINSDSTARIQMAKDWIASQPPMKERLADRIISKVKDLQIVSSGSQIPNYTVAPPSNLIIYQNSTTVLYPNQLDDLLKPNAGCIA